MKVRSIAMLEIFGLLLLGNADPVHRHEEDDLVWQAVSFLTVY